MKTLSKNIKYLIIGILVIIAFFKGPNQQNYMIGFLIAWVVFTVIRGIISKIRNNKQFDANIKKTEIIKKAKKFKKEKIDKFFMPEGIENTEAALKLHVNCRVTEKLKSAYPGAIWEWCGEFPSEMVTNGGTGRIKTTDTGEYNQADVTIDKYGRINFTMLKTAPLTNADNTGKDNDSGKTNPVDAAVWYSLIG